MRKNVFTLSLLVSACGPNAVKVHASDTAQKAICMSDMSVNAVAIDPKAEHAVPIVGDSLGISRLAQAFQSPNDLELAGVDLRMMGDGTAAPAFNVQLLSSLSANANVLGAAPLDLGSLRSPSWVTASFAAAVKLTKATTYYVVIEAMGSGGTVGWSYVTGEGLYEFSGGWTAMTQKAGGLALAESCAPASTSTSTTASSSSSSSGTDGTDGASSRR